MKQIIVSKGNNNRRRYKYMMLNDHQNQFIIGTLLLAIMADENERKEFKLANLNKRLYFRNIHENRHRLVILLRWASEGVHFSGHQRLFKIIKAHKNSNCFKINYGELFNYYLASLTQCSTADEKLPPELIRNLKTQKIKFIRFIKGFANTFNFKEKEWALFELSQTVAYACALHIDKLENNKDSPWHELGKFILQHTPTLSTNIHFLK